MVCETIAGLLKHDRNAFFHERGRSPVGAAHPPNGGPAVAIRDFLEFAGVAD